MRTPPAYSIPEQIAHLQQRGMAITDLEHAADCVRRIGYYRLSGYWRPFQVNRPDKAEAHPQTGRSLREMGFPPNWEQSAFWRGQLDQADQPPPEKGGDLTK